jgi:GT2 family glycosyltransferase
MNRPRVDVVILAWNDGELLDAALASALASEDVDVEVFVVDNGSDVPVTVPVRPDVHLLRQAENLGVARGRAVGVAAGTAPYVCLLDSDARLHPGSLAALAGTLEADDGVALAGPVFDGQRPEESGGRAPTLAVKVQRALGWRDDYRALGPAEGPSWDVDFVIGACQVFRRRAYDAAGGLDTTIFYGPEDVDLCLRMKAGGGRVVQVRAAGCDHPPRRRNRRLLTRRGLAHAWQVVRHLWRHREPGVLPAGR